MGTFSYTRAYLQLFQSQVFFPFSHFFLFLFLFFDSTRWIVHRFLLLFSHFHLKFLTFLAPIGKSIGWCNFKPWIIVENVPKLKWLWILGETSLQFSIWYGQRMGSDKEWAHQKYQTYQKVEKNLVHKVLIFISTQIYQFSRDVYISSNSKIATIIIIPISNLLMSIWIDGLQAEQNATSCARRSLCSTGSLSHVASQLPDTQSASEPLLARDSRRRCTFFRFLLSFYRLYAFSLKGFLLLAKN